nr:heparinase [Cytophagales bacterium]
MPKINITSILLVCLACFFAMHAALGQDKRDLLTSNFSRKYVENSLRQGDEWIRYPKYGDRSAWEALPEAQRRKTIEAGEAYVGYDWPIVKATMYLEFTRTGDRTKDAAVSNERRKAFQSLMLAELMEGKGRFIDDLINGVFAICEQTYWGASAHFYLYGFEGSIATPTTVLPDIDNPIIDLVVGDIAADLAWAYHFFKEPFDAVSPVIAKRLKTELEQKVLFPFYERYDYWWITGWGEGRVNNWTPWCNYNLLTAILLVEEDPIKKRDAIYKTMESVDLFINSYPDDGSCSEGPSYWAHAGGKMFDYLELLDTYLAEGVGVVFDHELIKNMGRYIYRSYISNGDYYINFADAAFRINHHPGRIYNYGQRISDPVMVSFAAFLMKNLAFHEKTVSGRIGESMRDLFDQDGWEKVTPEEPLIAQYYFPNLDAAIARDRAGTNEGFYFAAKGGSNGEQHNHNDVGSCMLFYNGHPVLLDVGVGTYTRETFSPQRYSIWTMQSNYHNLPLINGIGQSPGGSFRAINSSFNVRGNSVTYSTDISNAYPKEADVREWQRSYTLNRGSKFIVRDSFSLVANRGNTAIHYMTGLPVRLVQPGIVEFVGEDFIMEAKYDPAQVEAAVESIPLEDPKLIQNHGDELSRIVLTWKEKGIRGDLKLEVTAKKK